MVGVPRSQGCQTCRKRRVKCDEQKPACGNCIRSSRICAGYHKNQAFILSGYVETSDQKSGPLQLAQEAGSAPVLLSRWRIEAQPVKASKRASRERSFKHWAGPESPSHISPRNAFRDLFLEQLIHDKCPPDNVNRLHSSKHRNWIIQLPHMKTITPALEHSILAVSMARIGKQDGNLVLVRESLSLYTIALSELQRAINNPLQRYDEQNIAACMALTMYEFAECPGKATDGYMNHYNGAMRLLQLRGAESHDSGMAHNVLQVLRMHSVFQGLRNRQITFLAQPSWLEKPWRSMPKDPHDLLLDILLQIPNVYAKTDMLATASGHQQILDFGLEVIHEGCLLDAKLDGWIADYQSSTSSSLYRPELSRLESSVDSEELGKLFPVSFQFPSFIVAETMILYWTARVLLHAHLGRMSRRLCHIAIEMEEQKEEPSLGSLQPRLKKMMQSLKGIDEWPQTSARYICQSVEYLVQEKYRGYGPGTALPPLMVVQACLSCMSEDWSREVAWIREMITKIHGLGNNLAGFV